MKQNKPLVSILITTHNEENYIRKVIGNIMKQTYENIEIIIIDDGSDDKTPEIIGELSLKYSYIKGFLYNKIGRVHALNIGLYNCNGKYIAILDADDESPEKRIEKQVDFLENNIDYGLVGGWQRDIFLNGKEKIIKQPVQDEDIRKELVKNCCIVHSSVLVRSNIIKKIGYDFNYKHSMDYNMYVEVAKRYKVYNIPEVMAIYLHRINSITRKKNRFISIFYQTKIRFKAYKDLEVPIYYIIFLFKPIIENILPNSFIEWYVNKKQK